MKPKANFMNKLLAAGICILLFGSLASAATEKILHAFTITDGADPYSGVVIDSAGNLYGTTFWGGSTFCGGSGCGVVFKLAPAAGGGWTETAIYTFTGAADGNHPYSTLVFDAAGNLYGATYGAYYGGTGLGTVFKLTPQADGSWSFGLLHTFTGGKDGAQPSGTLAIDSAGHIFGTTNSGGTYNAGTAFEISPAGGGKWNETVLHTFTGGKDGSAPFGLILDAAGNPFGATNHGGQNPCDCGVVYELTHAAGGGWEQTVLHRFTGGGDGSIPGSLLFDSVGNLFGATGEGGNAVSCIGGCGVLFELTPGENSTWSETALFNFNGRSGNEPGGLVFGNGGSALYGSTYQGGLGAGLIFELAPGDNWTETVLYEFGEQPDDGGEPSGPLVLDKAGNLYGTTTLFGADDAGVVFEVTP